MACARASVCPHTLTWHGQYIRLYTALLRDTGQLEQLRGLYGWMVTSKVLLLLLLSLLVMRSCHGVATLLLSYCAYILKCKQAVVTLLLS